jgi:hypothetical protein
LTPIDKTTKGDREIPPKLIIWAGKLNYHLGKISSPVTVNGPTINKEYLTPPEIDWLAQGLSDFLELPKKAVGNRQSAVGKGEQFNLTS